MLIYIGEMEYRNRNKEILRLFKAGKTLKEIGEIFKISRSRAQQITDRETWKETESDILKKLNLDHKNLSGEEEKMLELMIDESVRKIKFERQGGKYHGIKKMIWKRMVETDNFQEFISVEKYAKSSGLDVRTLRKYFPWVIERIIKNRDRLWSLKYDKCRHCGNTSAKHIHLGLCKNCYSKNRVKFYKLIDEFENG